jgi:hypothetical protein
MKKVFPVLLIGILHCVAMTVMPQDMPSLRRRAEEIVKAKNPDWKLIRKQEREREVTYLWGPNEKADVVLTVFYGASKQEAADRMRATLNRLSMGPGKERSDIGDEAYFFTTEINDSGVLRFRKANVYIEIAASSAKVAEDLANSLAREIKKK